MAVDEIDERAIDLVEAHVLADRERRPVGEGEPVGVVATNVLGQQG